MVVHRYVFVGKLTLHFHALKHNAEQTCDWLLHMSLRRPLEWSLVSKSCYGVQNICYQSEGLAM